MGATGPPLVLTLRFAAGFVRQDVDMESETVFAESSSRFARIIIGVLCLIAILVVVAFLFVRSPQRFDPGTPEAAVQDFVIAVSDDDVDGAFALLTSDAARRCADVRDRDSFNRTTQRSELRNVVVDGNTATIDLRIRRGSVNDPFGGSGWSRDYTFDLVRNADGDWQIDHARWPFHFENC